MNKHVVGLPGLLASGSNFIKPELLVCQVVLLIWARMTLLSKSRQSTLSTGLLVLQLYIFKLKVKFCNNIDHCGWCLSEPLLTGALPLLERTVLQCSPCPLKATLKLMSLARDTPTHPYHLSKEGEYWGVSLSLSYVDVEGTAQIFV